MHEVRVHWWYRPDSYDEFVAASVAPEELDDEKSTSKGAQYCRNVNPKPYAMPLLEPLAAQQDCIPAILQRCAHHCVMPESRSTVA